MKKSKKSANVTSCNGILSIFAIIFSAIALLAVAIIVTEPKEDDTSVFSPVSVSSNYDEELINLCKQDLSDFMYEMGIENEFNEIDFEVTFDNKTHQYTVSSGGSSLFIEIPKEEDPIDAPTKVRSVKDKDTLDLIKRSKKLVYDYINKSTVLVNKSKVCRFIKNLEFSYIVPEMDDTDFVENFANTSACYIKQHVYLNPLEKNTYCEWVFVHELIHAICDYTHDFSEKGDYFYSRFNECMTELIVSTINPNLLVPSDYMLYTYLVSPYVGIFGNDALYAYFYSYEPIYKKYNKSAIDLYVHSLENLEYSEISYDVLLMDLSKMSLVMFTK